MAEFEYALSGTEMEAILKAKRRNQRREILLVDVREPREVEARGKIPFSVNLPSGEAYAALRMSSSAFKNKYGFDKPDKKTTVVFFCQRGSRGASVASMASEFGYKSVTFLNGGYDDWKKAKIAEVDEDDERGDL